HHFYVGNNILGGAIIACIVVSKVFSFYIGAEIARNLIGTVIFWWILDVVLILINRFNDSENRPVKDWVI
ncbi:membrane protein, partial [Candidatus Magnetobacterium bavaricum]